MHATPPGMSVFAGALQPGHDLFLIPAHLGYFDVYDVLACSWRDMQKFIRNLNFNERREVDITMGGHFPWWLCLATAGNMRGAIQLGVQRIAVCFHDGMPCILVSNNKGLVRVFDDPLCIEKLF